MTPFIAVTTVALRVIAGAIELRLEQYKARPELRDLDAENALLFGKWGQMVLKALVRLFEELDLDDQPIPLPGPPPE